MTYRILTGDVTDQLSTLPTRSVHCCVTSPPYWGLRDYGVEGQLGLEKTPQEYVEKTVEVFAEVWRVLRDDGTVWLNIGDSYNGSGGVGGDGKQHTNQGSVERLDNRAGWAGLKPKDLVLIPERLALALQDAGWYVRSRIAWCKKSSMPESVRDRPTSAWEHIWLLSKQAKYYYDAEAVRQTDLGTDHSHRNVLDGPSLNAPGQSHQSGIRSVAGRNGAGANLRNYWLLGPEPYPDAHFATFPSEIPRRAILAGTSAKGCCPECGAPWVREVDSIPATSKECPKTQAAHEARGGTGIATGTVGKSGSGRIDGYRRTTGWSPSCDHDANPIPCTVLDPFLGSGTTSLVAEQLGRDSIGIELNPEYAAMAEKRIQAGLPVTQRKSNEGTFMLDFTQ